MIQRIQSIFLMLTGITMVCMLFTSLWQKSDAESQGNVVITALYMVEKAPVAENPEAVARTVTFPYVIIGILALISGIIAFIELFKYKNRLTQIKLGALNALLLSATLVLSMYLILDVQKNFLPGVPGVYRIGIYFPVIGLIFNLLANRFIRRDEKLVRSVDRLR